MDLQQKKELLRKTSAHSLLTGLSTELMASCLTSILTQMCEPGSCSVWTHHSNSPKFIFLLQENCAFNFSRVCTADRSQSLLIIHTRGTEMNLPQIITLPDLLCFQIHVTAKAPRSAWLYYLSKKVHKPFWFQRYPAVMTPSLVYFLWRLLTSLL